jgi:hypothetical protein
MLELYVGCKRHSIHPSKQVFLLWLQTPQKLILKGNFTRYYGTNKYNKLSRDITINNTGNLFNCQCQGISHNPLLFTVLGSSIKTWSDKGSHQFRTPSNFCFWTSPWPWELWRKENTLEQREADKLEFGKLHRVNVD